VSWQKLMEKGFWQKLSTEHQPMSYTAICEVLKEEHRAANHLFTEQAYGEYGDRFSSVFKYRRGSEHIVRNKESAVAKRYLSLHDSD
jgi:hypothetical protein